MNRATKSIDEMIGEKNDRLTIVEYVGTDEKKQRLWKCRCDCGNYVIKSTNSLHMQGKRHSCGCIRREHPNNTRHGMCYTRINSIYRKMKQRCFWKDDPRYKDYGGRGITITSEWLGRNGFLNFYKWAMENGYSDELSIDRINVNGNYEPSNCRWITMKEQSRNTRKTIWITYNGETRMLKEWSEYLNIPYERLRQRLFKLGWDVERAFNT